MADKEELIIQSIKALEMRLEAKLDKLAETILTVARIEERQLEQSKAIERLWIKEKEQDINIHSLEEALLKTISSMESRNTFVVKFIYPLAVLATGGICGYIFTKAVI